MGNAPSRYYCTRMRIHIGGYTYFLIALLHAVSSVFTEQRGGKIVYPELLSSREFHGGRVLKITDGITLNLKKSTVLEREFLLRTYADGIPMHTYMSGPYLEEDLYHDEASMASVAVSEESGVQVEGIVNPRRRIVPLPSQERHRDGRIAHRLIEIPDDASNHDGDYEFPASKLMRSLTEDGARNRRVHLTERSSDTVYPELFVVVDSAFAAAFTSNSEIIKYVSISVNAMNLRYLGVTSPKVKHRLVGIEVTTAEKEWFLRRVTVNRKYVHSQGTLASFQTYIAQNRDVYGKADIVYLLTGQDLATVKNHQVNNGNAGFAYIGTVCTVNKVGVGEDRPPTFKGVHVMAHEIGHILGCLHDGEYSPYGAQGIPGSESCPFQDGYLMSYVRKNSNTYKFSQCSMTQIRETSRLATASCLHEENYVHISLKKYNYLPGQLMTRTRQCQNAFPTLKNVHFIEKLGVTDCAIKCGTSSKNPVSELKTLHLSDGTKCKTTSKKKYNCINGLCLERRRSYGYEAVP